MTLTAEEIRRLRSWLYVADDSDETMHDDDINLLEKLRAELRKIDENNL